MSILQVVGVAFLFALMGNSCDGSDYIVMSEDVKYTLFGEKFKSFEQAVYESSIVRANVANNYFVKVGVNVVATAGAAIPVVGPLFGFLPVLREALESESNWRMELARAVDKNVDIKLLENEVINIRSDLYEIIAKYKHFETTKNKNSRKQQMLDIEPMIDTMILRVSKGESLFRLYPSLALPALLAITEFTFVINATLRQYVPRTEIFCKLRQAYDINFHPTFLDRVRKVDIHTDYPHYPVINRNALLQKIKQTRKPSEKLDEIRCMVESVGYREKMSKFTKYFDKYGVHSDEADKGFSLLKDEFNKMDEDYFIDEKSKGECEFDYLALIQYRLWEFFKNVSSQLDPFCKPKICKGLQNKTGYGWLRIDIGAVKAVYNMDKHLCDTAASLGGPTEGAFCDPYFKVFIDEVQVFKTKTIWNAAGWHSLDEVFHSKRILYNSTIKFQLIDDDGEGYAGDLLVDNSMSIEKAESTCKIIDISDRKSDSFAFVNVFWRPEYRNQNVDCVLQDFINKRKNT